MNFLNQFFFQIPTFFGVREDGSALFSFWNSDPKPYLAVSQTPTVDAYTMSFACLLMTWMALFPMFARARLVAVFAWVRLIMFSAVY